MSGIGRKRTRQKEGKERWWRPAREAAQVTFHWYHSNSTYVSEHKTRPVYCSKHCCSSRSLLLNRATHLMFYCGHVSVLSVLLHLASVAVCESFVFLCWHCIDVFLLYTSFSNACNSNRPVICSQCHRFARAVISVTISYFEFAFSALTLLVGRQEGHPARKNWVVRCWCGYLSGARCRLAYGPADATATHCLLLQ